MDIEKLIEQLSARGLSNGSSLGYHSGLFDEAATALSTLQAENAQLRGELEYEQEHANAYHEECGQWEAENEKLRAELAELRAQWDMYGGDEGITATYAELERAKAERDAAIKKFETEKEDFLDYALSGTQNAAPFCRNRHPDCVDKRGWCIPVKCHGFSRDEED